METIQLKQKTDLNRGLTAKQVEERIQKGEVNTQINRVSKRYSRIIYDNTMTLFNLINVILAAFIIFIQSWRNLLFLGTIVCNIVIGIVQEIRAKRILDKLSLFTQSNIHVLRDHETSEVHIGDLVMDDLMLLTISSQIPADAIIREGKLEVNESLVTGESDIIIKTQGDLLYSGSFVVSGQATAQIVHVGSDNYANTIMQDAKVMKRHQSQLRDSINFIIKTIGIIIIPMGCLLFFKQFFISDYAFPEAIVGTVAALIGMIPEGLVLLTSVALAVGTINLAKKKTLVQELYCIETLARVDVLCLDKTGTITEGNMQVEGLVMKQGDDELGKAILANVYHALSDENATAQAIRKFAGTANDYQVLHALPFSSSRKCCAVSFQDHGTYAIGAYEFVTNKKEDAIRKEIDDQANAGNRVLVIAHSSAIIKEDQDEIDRSDEIIGYVTLSDPIRKEAPVTLDYFLSQGVDVKVISGDDPKTVHEIARKAKLKNYDKYIDASTLTNEELPHAAETYTVFGRVSPIQKKLLIKALKEQGHTTAMIGDGVNDVMALKEADCSISVAEGSESAKSVANLVLLDNNFASMPHIVDEGRRVINNIQRAASLFLVKTTFSTLISFLTLFLIAKYPFEPIQLTLISTVTIGIPSFFLALEANHTRVDGNFLLNVFSRAIPGALCVVLSIIYVHISSQFFTISDEHMTTMSVLLTGASSLIVLYRVCLPFTKKRFLIFIIMTSLFVLCVIFLPNVFNLVRLNFWLAVLTLIGFAAIPFIQDFCFRFAHMVRLKERIEKLGHKKV